MFQTYLEKVRQNKPVIHAITNYVTAGACANMLLACGASPIMADDPLEAAEISRVCHGLVLNMGTFSQSRLEAMMAAGKEANQLGHPIVLDPVGIGASEFRSKGAQRLLENLNISAIRGNLSEIRTLTNVLLKIRDKGWETEQRNRGVDVSFSDVITKNTLGDTIDLAKRLAQAADCVVVITGEIDVAADSRQAVCIYNGHEMMKTVTGTGCQLSSLIAAFLAADRMDRKPSNPILAAAAATMSIGICGEQAWHMKRPGEGNAAFGNAMIDAMYCLDAASLERDGRYEIQ